MCEVVERKSKLSSLKEGKAVWITTKQGQKLLVGKGKKGYWVAAKQGRKIAIFKGEKGYWVTTRQGRKVFIPEEKFKGYKDWRRVGKISALAVGGGTLGVGLKTVTRPYSTVLRMKAFKELKKLTSSLKEKGKLLLGEKYKDWKLFRKVSKITGGVYKRLTPFAKLETLVFAGIPPLIAAHYMSRMKLRKMIDQSTRRRRRRRS